MIIAEQPSATTGRTPDGWLYPRALEPAAMIGKLADRALLAYVTARTPGYLSRGGVPRAKTFKARQEEAAVARALAEVLTADFGIRVDAGNTTEAIMGHLAAIGQERGLLGPGPACESLREYGPWALWDVMSEERRAREWARYHPGRPYRPREAKPS